MVLLLADNLCSIDGTEVTDAFAEGDSTASRPGIEAALAEVRRLSGELQRMGRALGLEMPTAAAARHPSRK